jgi:hypothetical protein
MVQSGNPLPATDELPHTVNEVLADEVGKLRPGWLQDFTAAKWDVPNAQRFSNLKELYHLIHTLGKATQPGSPRAERQDVPLSAICLSGGGIRSATFNLGVLQSLAKRKLLGQFDYLSSVSGGGYIASWLRTWMYHDGSASVLNELAHFDPVDPLTPEPEEVRALREYSNYLTPRLGLFSGDTWAAATMILRNVILNWLVIVPLIAMVTALPLLFLLIVKLSGSWVSSQFGLGLLQLALGVETFASISVYALRRFVKKSNPVMNTGGKKQGVFIALCAIPIFAAAALLCWSGVELNLPWLQKDAMASPMEVWQLFGFCALWCIGVPLFGWLLVEFVAALTAERMRGSSLSSWEGSRLAEFSGLLIAGLIAAGLMFTVVIHLLHPLREHPALFVTLAAPALLGLYLLARALFVAIAGLANRGAAGDADREWWARLSGWLLLLIVFWMVGTAVCFLGAYLLESVSEFKKHVMGAVGGMAGLTGSIGALLASRGGKQQPSSPQPTSGGKQVTMFGFAWLFIANTIVLVTWLTIWLGELLTGHPGIFNVSPDSVATLPARSDAAIVVALILGLFLMASVTGLVVNVNRFSLHGMYRSRLIRAYLGASNAERKADPFTGFAIKDNPRLHKLWHGSATYPLPIINTTLNVTHGEDLAWQQRKAQSFSMTPFHCGNFRNGYRRSESYGGPGGISVGTAVTISGAAANPEMGQNSSPAMSFLMTLFNVRLGAWLGNTNERGKDTYQEPGPRQALRPLLTELFGLADADGRYVNLSDGGHFDNLGLYEVVLRRCRYVFISDAGQDDKFTFEDLGNAIRKIRIDFGVRIEFKKEIRILPRNPVGNDPKTGFYCATAIIHYEDMDESAQPGKLVYIKPTICGENPVPYDVYSYSRASDMFPHEPTSDQWFSESQFESYRALGRHIFEQLPTAGSTIQDFIEYMHANLHELPGTAIQPSDAPSGA